MRGVTVLITVCILLISCLTILLLCRPKQERYDQTIAVYGANFGGYRNEIDNQKLKACTIDETVDYFFFTDQRNLNCDGWNIRYPDKLPGDHVMDSNRWTSKATKWKVPEELRSYNVIVWVDSKLFPMSYLRSTVTELFNKHPGKDLFILKHPYGRQTSIGEMHATVRGGVENNSDKVEEFYNILSDFKDPIPLADTCQLVMRNTPQLLEMLENVFNTLQHFELKRDQCVFNYALVQSGYPVSKVCITPNMPIGRPILNPGRGQFQKARDAEKKVIRDILSLKSGKLISDSE